MSKAFTGRTQFVSDVTQEDTEEAERTRLAVEAGNIAREEEANRFNLWSFIGTVLALPFAGPSAPLIGTTLGNIAKSSAVDESLDIIADPSDVGKWNISKDREALLAINQQFKDYDTAEFWGGLKDLGTSALFAYQHGGGMGPGGITPGEFSPFKWGGRGGKTTGEAWKSFWSPDEDPYTTVGDTGLFR